MNFGNLDWVALSRAFGISLITGAIVFYVTNKSRKPTRILISIGLVIVLTTSISYLWPSLVKIPSIDGKSRAEAEDLLTKMKLIPKAIPQTVVGVESGRVVPKSQSPNAGLLVRPDTVVSFGVSNYKPDLPASSKPAEVALNVSLFEPKSSNEVICSPDDQGIYRFQVNGTSSGLSVNEHRLLLWVKPVSPPAPGGWYLQRPPRNGINLLNDNSGSWTGEAQIGNEQYPPHDGDTVDVAVTIADKTTADDLMNQAGVVTNDTPVGIKTDTASNLGIKIK